MHEYGKMCGCALAVVMVLREVGRQRCVDDMCQQRGRPLDYDEHHTRDLEQGEKRNAEVWILEVWSRKCEHVSNISPSQHS